MAPDRLKITFPGGGGGGEGEEIIVAPTDVYRPPKSKPRGIEWGDSMRHEDVYRACYYDVRQVPFSSLSLNLAWVSITNCFTLTLALTPGQAHSSHSTRIGQSQLSLEAGVDQQPHKGLHLVALCLASEQPSGQRQGIRHVVCGSIASGHSVCG